MVYGDGFIETIPIRYGVNILEWGWARSEKLNKKTNGLQAIEKKP